MKMKYQIAILRVKDQKIIHNNEWWFSVADVIEVLTESVDVKQYIKKMRKRDKRTEFLLGYNLYPP